MTQEMARGFSLFKEALLIFEIQDPNVEQSVKGAAAVQNAIQCCSVNSDEKKKTSYPDDCCRLGGWGLEVGPWPPPAFPRWQLPA